MKPEFTGSEFVKQKKRIINIIEILEINYPFSDIELNYQNPFQLLIATILSAQCSDKRVNLVTERLFKKFIEIEDYLIKPLEELEKEIFSTGFYKAKANNIRLACKMILDNYNGKVPDTMENLLKLPGVGRKTANVLLGHCFSTPGIVVDTHVGRLAKRLGLTKGRTAKRIEYTLMDIVPKKKWVLLNHLLINHGRKICKSQKPRCQSCSVESLCPKINLIPSLKIT